MRENVDITIIGGGFFCLYLSEYYFFLNKKVLIVEKEKWGSVVSAKSQKCNTDFLLPNHHSQIKDSNCDARTPPSTLAGN